MKLIFIFLASSILFLMTKNNKVDFGLEKAGQDWQVINDGVMGGLSSGKANLKNNSIFFQGKVSLENNGGFASLRSVFRETDLSDYQYIKLRVRNKGIAFAFTLETSSYWFQPNFKHRIEVDSEDWQEITLPLKGFKQYRIGRPTGKKLQDSDKKDIIRMGIISDDKRADDFEIEIDYILFE